MLKQETYKEKSKRIVIVNIEKHMKEMQTQIEALEKGFLADAPAVWGEIDSRLSALEKGMTILQNNQSALMKQYLDQQKRLDEEKPDDVVTNVTDRLTVL
ncbi:MAG: hypothetical protein GWP10_21655, partial [Nitrospiraceae bacterium]|nr:hypothetical protein [Nitrospiraceae bacterium]